MFSVAKVLFYSANILCVHEEDWEPPPSSHEKGTVEKTSLYSGCAVDKTSQAVVRIAKADSNREMQKIAVSQVC